MRETAVRLGPLAGERERWLTTLPFVFFAVLTAISWNRWILPFQDSGREVITADRILRGEALYRDVVSRYGPLPPHLDALALACSGRQLFSLVALRLAFALLGIEALRRLASRLAPGASTPAAIVSLVVAACAFLPFGGAWPFPYSVAALEGTVGIWIALELSLSSSGPRRTLAAGIVSGLAAGTKLEMVIPALLAPALALLWRRPRREALAGIGLAATLGALAWGVPVVWLGADVMWRNGFLLGGAVPAPWRHLYSDVFSGGLSIAQLLSGAALVRYLPSAGLLLGFVLVARKLSAARWQALALFTAGFLALAFPENGGLHVLIPLAGLLALWQAVGLVRDRALCRPGERTVAMLCIGVAMLPALARQPFFLTTEVPYSALSGPLALVFSLSWLAARFPGSGRTAAFVLGLATAQLVERAVDYRAAPRTTVAFERATLCLLDQEAILLSELVSRLRQETPPGSYVAGFPDAGLVLFLADRRSPFADDQFHPGSQDIEAEREMIRGLDRHPPAAGFFLNRAHPEYGLGVFGIDYGLTFMEEFRKRMAPPVIVGHFALDPPRGLRASTALYFLPRPATGPP
jgi:hypothetical protein